METRLTGTDSALLALSDQLAAAVEQASLTVVAINARPRVPSSGVHWLPGVVVSAAHTIERGDDITVTLPDGRTVPATLAGRDRGTDLAVLKLQGVDLPAAEIGDSASLKVGHLVLAVGRAGESISTSLGVVSFLSGPWRTWRGGQIDRFIRLDMSIHLGFSGGPLVDIAGRIVGINTSGLWRNTGMAIPASTVNRVAKELLEKGRIAKGYLGVGMQPVRLPDILRSQLKTPSKAGMIVLSVEPDGPAFQAGVLIGDVLVALNDKTMVDMSDVQGMLGTESVGNVLRAAIIRGGAPLELSIKVGERPEKEG